MSHGRKFEFGKRSAANLDTCAEALQRVARRALSWGIVDFSVIEGHRSVERQQELYSADPPLTHIDGITQKGQHNYMPSRAMDLLPYPGEINGVNVWEDRQRFCLLAGIIFSAAAVEGVQLRWGGDWDGDGNNADSSFHDLPHFEVVQS